MTIALRRVLSGLACGPLLLTGCTRSTPPELMPLLSIGGRTVDMPARVRACPPPSFPLALRELGYAGRATLEFTIDTLGRADTASVRVVSADHPAFALSARRALARCRFTPGRASGRPVAMRSRIVFSFTLL